jgi:hypothetical protein
MNEKQARKRCRELADEAYEEELRRALAPLAEAFERWKAKAASSFEISDLIHEFHRGPSRKIWGMYSALKPEELVARAVVVGLLPPGSLPPELEARLADRIAAFKGLAGEEP